MQQHLFDKYHGKICTHDLGERDIIALRSQLNRCTKPSGPVRLASGRTGDAHSVLLRAIKLCKPLICDVQASKGIEWLRKQWLTPLGYERKHNPFTSAHINVLTDFSHFKLVELRNVSGSESWGSLARPYYLPVYRVYSLTGAWFDYVAYVYSRGKMKGLSDVKVTT